MLLPCSRVLLSPSKVQLRTEGKNSHHSWLNPSLTLPHLSGMRESATWWLAEVRCPSHPPAVTQEGELFSLKESGLRSTQEVVQDPVRC